MRFMVHCAVFLGLIAIAGCGGSGTCTVSGKVTIKGKPVCTGVINLVSPSGEIVTGGIDEEGNYTVINVTTGDKKVSIISDKPLPSPVNVVKYDPDLPPPPAPLPSKAMQNWVPVDAKYGNAETSGKTMTLKSGSNTINIELE